MATFRETSYMSVKTDKQRENTNMSSRTQKYAQSVVTEMYCGPCSRDGQHHDAEGFCIDCSEYFCNTCIKHHRNLKITKNHVLRDRKTMPKYKQLSESDEQDESTSETCDIHTSELLRYFCKDHDEPCYSVCATLKHRQCNEILYIPDIKAKKTNKQSELMLRRIRILTNQFDKVHEETNKNIETLDTQRSEFQQAVLKTHQDIVAMLHRLEKNVARDMSIVHESEKGYLVKRAEACSDTIKSLQFCSGNLNIALKNGIESKSFLQLKKTAKQVAQFEALLEAMKYKNSDTLKFQFRSSRSTKELLKNMTSLGMLEIVNRPTKSATFVKEFKITSQSDSYQVCDITGCIVLQDGRILLADMYNESLKLFGTNNKLVAHSKLSAEPWDLSLVHPEQVVLTLPREKKLQFYTVGTVLRPQHKIGPTLTKSSQFYGVVYHEQKLYVSCPKDDPPSIKILDMQGKELRTITASPQERNLFSDPLYLTISNDGRVIYVSDSGNNTVISLQLKSDGQVKTYSDSENNPMAGLVIQPDGNLYVCGFKTKSILNLTSECMFVNSLIEGGLKNPQAVCYSPIHQQLVVTMQKSDVVKIFQLS